MNQALQTLEPLKKGLFLTCLWALWWNRNSKLMDSDSLMPANLASFILAFHTNYVEVNLMTRQPRSPLPPARWKKPPPGVIKLNFDGALFSESREFGFGVIARDSTGLCVGWMSDKRGGLLTPEAVEALAALEAVRLELDRGWSNVIFEGDCLNVVEKICSDDLDYSAIGNINQEIKSLVSAFNSVSFCFTPRGANSAAHTIARHAAPGCSGVFNFPVVASSCVQFDMAGDGH